MNDEVRVTVMTVLACALAILWLVTQKWFWLTLGYALLAISTIMCLLCLAYLNIVGFFCWLIILTAIFWIKGLWDERAEATV